MVKKTPIKGSDKVAVTFETMMCPDAKTLHLVGDFNDWNPDAHPMKQRKDGTWSITLRLTKHRDWQYRYVVNGADWVTDDEDGDTAPNPYGSVNASVLA